MLNRLLGFYAVIALLGFAPVHAAELVVVCSSMNGDVTRSVAERFTKETDTAVKLVQITGQGTRQNLLTGLVGEKGGVPVDVFWSSDLATAISLKSEGLSVPYESPNENEVSRPYSDPEHYWTGFPDEARVIVYNKNLLVDPDAVPTSVFDMINPRFNARVCMANPLSGTTLFHAAALFQVLGQD